MKVTSQIVNYVDSQNFGIELCRRTIDNIRIKLNVNMFHRVRLFDLTLLHIEKLFDFVQFKIKEDTAWDYIHFKDESCIEVGLETTVAKSSIFL
jgi:hypothetical protein